MDKKRSITAHFLRKNSVVILGDPFRERLCGTINTSVYLEGFTVPVPADCPVVVVVGPTAGTDGVEGFWLVVTVVAPPAPATVTWQEALGPDSV